MLKRDWCLFLRCLVPALLLTVVFAAVSFAAAMTAARGAESVYTPIRVTVVDREDSLLSRMLISMVSETDYISDFMELEKCGDETRAMERLRSGENAAVIVLPENFVNDIMHGRISEGRIVLSADAASHSEVVESAARFGEFMLAAGQYAVFSGEELIRQHELGEDFHSDFLAQVNAGLLDEAMTAGEKYFRTETLGDSGMDTAQWYALCWLSFVTFICSMFFEKLYRTDLRRGLLCRLRTAGLGDLSFCLGKLLYPFLFRIILFIPALFASGNLNFCSILWLLAALLAASLMGFAIMLCSDKGAAVCAVLAAAGIFLCGGVIPRQFMPQLAEEIGFLTPYGVVQSLMSPAFGGRICAANIAGAAVYCCACVLLIRAKLRFERVRGAEV